jgi:hypothetical protein
MARRAPLPSAEHYAQRLRNKQQNQAEPGRRDGHQPPGQMKTYRVMGNRICHGKKKGDLVELWDTGATLALVKAGHLVVVEVKDQEADSAD